MTSHPTLEILLRFSAGTLRARDRDRVAVHLKECEKCSSSYQHLSPLLVPSTKGLKDPPSRVEKAIRASYRKYSPRLERPSNSIFQKPAWVLSAALVLLVAGLSVMYSYSVYLQRQNTIPISISYLKGKALLNGLDLGTKSRITENSTLSVLENSAVVLSYNGIFTIKIGSRSVLDITKAMVDIKKNRMEFGFNLKRGTLFTRFDGIDGSSKYFYLTPHASIHSSKTEFILKVVKNHTIVIPRSGTVEIKSLASDEVAVSLPSKKYIITSSIESRETNELDELSADMLGNIDNPQNETDMGELEDFLKEYSDSI